MTHHNKSKTNTKDNENTNIVNNNIMWYYALRSSIINEWIFAFDRFQISHYGTLLNDAYNNIPKYKGNIPNLSMFKDLDNLKQYWTKNTKLCILPTIDFEPNKNNGKLYIALINNNNNDNDNNDNDNDNVNVFFNNNQQNNCNNINTSTINNGDSYELDNLSRNNTYKHTSFLKNIIKEDNNEKSTLKQIDILINKKYKQVKYLKLSHDDTIHNYIPYEPVTNKLCFWCCHSFDNHPWGMPVKYNDEQDYFVCKGNFCSPNCTLSYINEKYNNSSRKWEYISLLNFLYFKCFSKTDIIQPAPDKYCLTEFGGPLDINEYRLLTLNNNYIFSINFPICYNIIPFLEQRNNTIKQDSYFVSIDTNKDISTKTKYKIKRTKPIYANKNTLEKILSS